MFDSGNQFVLSAIVVLLGGVLAVLIGRWLGRRSPVVVALYAWHTILGFFYSGYVLTYGPVLREVHIVGAVCGGLEPYA